MCTLKKENQYGSGKSEKILTQFKGILTVNAGISFPSLMETYLVFTSTFQWVRELTSTQNNQFNCLTVTV